jgi:hypothetical protein
MPIWKFKLLVLTAVLMLMGRTCVAQDAPVGAAPTATAASAAARAGSPTPYSAPLAVPSAAGQIPPLRLASPVISVTPSPAPRFAASCDSSGCWGSDGTRYNAIGGALVRPDGKMCQDVGGVMQCP